VRALARAVRDGVMRFNNSEEDVIRGLTKLPGVGAWTAHYVALQGLGDPDAFLTGDFACKACGRYSRPAVERSSPRSAYGVVATLARIHRDAPGLVDRGV